jgi:predicted transcriptional regulator
MSKQFISEAQRMQKLANMPISEMALPEMARTAGTGGAYTITEKGEEILKQAKASGKAPEGIKNSELATLVFLFKAKKDGKRVQKIDYAKERNVPQPAVNPIFNSLEVKELISKEGYTSKQQEPKTSRPRPDVDAMLGDLDIEESKKELSENQPAIYNDIKQDLMYGGFESIEDQIDYLQDIIKFCQEKIKEISGGLNENIDKDKLKKYYEYLLNLGGGDLGGDYGDMLNKAKDFSSVEEFIEDDINILATDNKAQAIEIRKWVEQNIK